MSTQAQHNPPTHPKTNPPTPTQRIFQWSCADPWSWAEDKLRELETENDSFKVWQRKLLKAVAAYPAKHKLVGSMARKCRQTLERAGDILDD